MSEEECFTFIKHYFALIISRICLELNIDLRIHARIPAFINLPPPPPKKKKKKTTTKKLHLYMKHKT